MRVNKSFNGRVPHTEYVVTDLGREALEQYWRDMDAIRRIPGVAREEGSSPA